MLDLTVRALAWILTLCTPHPQGRHRLGTPPPLRFTPAPPPRRPAASRSTSKPPNTAANANAAEPPTWPPSASIPDPPTSTASASRRQPDDPPRPAHVRPLRAHHRGTGPGPRGPRPDGPRLQCVRVSGLRGALPAPDGRTRHHRQQDPPPLPPHPARLQTRHRRHGDGGPGQGGDPGRRTGGATAAHVGVSIVRVPEMQNPAIAKRNASTPRRPRTPLLQRVRGRRPFGHDQDTGHIHKRPHTTGIAPVHRQVRSGETRNPTDTVRPLD